MEDVIENCQTTFEEDGVNQQTLEDLKSVGGPSLYLRVSLTRLAWVFLTFVLFSSRQRHIKKTFGFSASHRLRKRCGVAERISLYFRGDLAAKGRDGWEFETFGGRLSI